MQMHGRESKGKKKPTTEDIHSELSLFHTDEIRTQLLSSKGQHSRQKWLTWVEVDLTNASSNGSLNEETLNDFIEILVCCLNDSKGGVSIKAVRVALLSYLWCMGTKAGDEILAAIKNLMYSNYNSCRTTEDKIEWLIHLTIFLISINANSKEMDSFIRSFIIPFLEKSTDSLLNNDSEDDEEHNEKTQFLKEAISSWMTLTPLIDDEHVISKLINDTSDLFVQLLEHQDIEVKLLASESFVIIANIIDTFGYDDMFEIDLEETLKEIRRTIYESDYELSRDDKNKILKFIETIESKNFVSLVTSIVVPNKLENVRHNIKDRMTFEKNKNKKGHPETGFSEAWIIEYLRQKLGHVFSELSNYELQTTDLRSTTGFSDLINSIVGRNEAAEEYTSKIENLRNFGTFQVEEETKTSRKEKSSDILDLN